MKMVLLVMSVIAIFVSIMLLIVRAKRFGTKDIKFHILALSICIINLVIQFLAAK